MIRKHPEKDLDNPPGQIVNPIPPSHLEKPLQKQIQEYMDTEEYFVPPYGLGRECNSIETCIFCKGGG